MAHIGYARVSKDEQNLDLQLDALKKQGCVRIFTDKATGTTFSERKELQKCLEYLNPGDTLVGSGSLEKDSSIYIIAMEEEEQASLVHDL
jgi:DNA invertase Pin-like site-specific DNA recombinase